MRCVGALTAIQFTCRYYPLKIRFLTGEHARMRQGCPNPPSHVPISVGPLQDLNVNFQDSEESSTTRNNMDTIHYEKYSGTQTAAVTYPSRFQGQTMVQSSENESRHFIMMSDDDSTTILGKDYLNGSEEVSSTKVKTQGKEKKKRVSSCTICGKAANRTWLVCSGCNMRSHIECLAEHSLQNNLKSKHLHGNFRLAENTESTGVHGTLPEFGVCPSCGISSPWIEFLTNAKNTGWGPKRSPKLNCDQIENEKDERIAKTFQTDLCTKTGEHRANVGVRHQKERSKNINKPECITKNAAKVKNEKEQNPLDVLTHMAQKSQGIWSKTALTSKDAPVSPALDVFRIKDSIQQGQYNKENLDMTEQTSSCIDDTPLNSVIDLSLTPPLAVRLKQRALSLQGSTALNSTTSSSHSSPDIIEIL